MKCGNRHGDFRVKHFFEQGLVLGRRFGFVLQGMNRRILVTLSHVGAVDFGRVQVFHRLSRYQAIPAKCMGQRCWRLIGRSSTDPSVGRRGVKTCAAGTPAAAVGFRMGGCGTFGGFGAL